MVTKHSVENDLSAVAFGKGALLTFMTLPLFLIVALSSAVFPLPCHAQTETILSPWPPALTSSSAGFDSPEIDESDLDLTAESLEPTLHLSLHTPGPPLSPGPTEAVHVLWQAQKPPDSTEPEPPPSEETTATETEELTAYETIVDPFEPLNRVAFQFNDKFYFWLLKPVASVYKAALPQDLRVCIRNFFSNLATPVRVGNCLLQARLNCAANETGRFLLNSTFGFFGFFDQAKDKFEVAKEERDFGQTLGIWGLGPLFYINWPILGPSSLRDTAGFVGDLFLDPRTYLLDSTFSIIVRPVELVNEASLRIGEYEDFKKAALDPYVSMRDGYHQYRQNKIKQKK